MFDDDPATYFWYWRDMGTGTLNPPAVEEWGLGPLVSFKTTTRMKKLQMHFAMFDGAGQIPGGFEVSVTGAPAQLRCP